MKKVVWMVGLIGLMGILNSCSHEKSMTPDDPGYYSITDGDYFEGDYGEGVGGGPGAGSQGGNEQSQAGRVTAGEWRDLDNWLFWSGLMTENIVDSSETNEEYYPYEIESYGYYCSYWGFYTNNRVAVRLTDASGAPQKDVPVQLVRLNGENPIVLYEARTDNKGETNLWLGLTQEQKSVDATTLALVVNGAQQPEAVRITHFGEEPVWNAFTASVAGAVNMDIAFIVDATGSMTDEIDFLKADLTNIISTVQSRHADANIRTAAVFYRDEGDDYLTRESDFSANLSTTTAFIELQTADGGGDYPEAVHSALQAGIQKLSWHENNCIRLAFMLLDAPPHKNDQVIASLQQSIPQYSKAGIRIIPVAASGIDKTTEFFLRFTAIATDGTYVFLTNDSGVGGDHIKATVGEYKVELLNELIVRLIEEYLE